MSFKSQTYEWDIPSSEVQYGIPVGHKVELSLNFYGIPVTYELDTFHETKACSGRLLQSSKQEERRLSP